MFIKLMAEIEFRINRKRLQASIHVTAGFQTFDLFLNWWPVYEMVKFAIGSQHTYMGVQCSLASEELQGSC